jgi:hypothetical protein
MSGVSEALLVVSTHRQYPQQYSKQAIARQDKVRVRRCVASGCLEEVQMAHCCQAPAGGYLPCGTLPGGESASPTRC